MLAATALLSVYATTAYPQDTPVEVDEVVKRLTATTTELVQLTENGDVVREGDPAWKQAGETCESENVKDQCPDLYTLINGSSLIVQGESYIDEGSCRSGNCSNNNFEKTLTLDAPNGWGFGAKAITYTERGHGARGHGVRDVATKSRSIGNTALSVIQSFLISHECRRAGGAGKGGCSSRVYATGVAVRAP
ncbi:hypothetical protein [Paracoccus denitrificans]|uniref:hypothetical protein n=1 Tax=Paracoccus denitrificans TaxID=266 RepID=UPI003364EE85